MGVCPRQRRIERRRRADAWPDGAGMARIPGFMARCRSGAAAIEFALAVPVFLLMVYGMVEMGRLFWIQSTLQYAVEESVRYAIVNNAVLETDVANVAAAKAATVGATATNFTVTFETLLGARTFVTVQAAYPFSLLTPLVPVPPFNITTRYRSAVVQ